MVSMNFASFTGKIRVLYRKHNGQTTGDVWIEDECGCTGIDLENLPANQVYWVAKALHLALQATTTLDRVSMEDVSKAVRTK